MAIKDILQEANGFKG